MTPGRRTLRYESFDEVMPDVERLLEGHRTVGNWSLARICRHLAAVLRRHVDLPASTRLRPGRSGSPRSRSGGCSSRASSPRGSAPRRASWPETVGDEREEAEGLRAAIAYYKASPGPAIPHRILGPLTREEWDRFQLIHLAHHLSFAVPAAG